VAGPVVAVKGHQGGGERRGQRGGRVPGGQIQPSSGTQGVDGGQDRGRQGHRVHQNSANPKEGVEQQVLSESRSSVHGGGRGGKAHLYLVSNYESTIISIFLLTVFT